MSKGCERCGECCVDVAVNYSRSESAYQLRLLNRREKLTAEDREQKTELEKMRKYLVWNGRRYRQGWYTASCKNLVPARNGTPAWCKMYGSRMELCKDFRCY